MELASMHILSFIANVWEAKKHVISVMMDLSKVFDTLDYDILLGKIISYGITGPSHSWLKSYLSGRTQVTKVNNALSGNPVLSCGVPQGLILGPLLFLIYTNDIRNCIILEASLVLYADDCTYLLPCKDPNLAIATVNRDLAKLAAWYGGQKKN